MATKRVIVAMTVPEEQATHDVAIELDFRGPGSDATVWEWQDFFRDVEDGAVSPHHDTTEVTS